MKFSELRSIGHNIADSLGSGVGLLVSAFDIGVFEEAGRSAEGFIEVDFLAGTSSGGPISASLTGVIGLYMQALPTLCEKHGTVADEFTRLTARYHGRGGARFFVTVGGRNGRLATDEYVGTPGMRRRELDALGRIRALRRPISPTLRTGSGSC